MGTTHMVFLHSMALAYPKKIDTNNPEHLRIKDGMYAFLNNLGTVLPCNVCSHSYNNYIKEPSFKISNYLDSRAKLFYYIYLLHNKVNKKLGVPDCYIPSFKEVIKTYGKFLVGPDQCKLTNIEQQIKNKLKGCNSNDINMNFKKYKSIVTILDKDTNTVEDDDQIKSTKNENEKKQLKEYFGKTESSNKSNVILLIFLIIFICTTVLLFILYIKK